MANIHVNRGATSLGVFSEEEVREGLRNHRFLPGDLGWREGMANWQPLSQFTEFAGDIGSSGAPQVPPPQPTLTATPASGVPVTVGKTEPLAIWSLVLSCVGLLCCGFILGIGGVVCGHLALSNLRKNSTLEGRGLATAGLIIGYVAIVFWLAYIVFFGGAAILNGIREGMSK